MPGSQPAVETSKFSPTYASDIIHGFLLCMYKYDPYNVHTHLSITIIHNNTRNLFLDLIHANTRDEHSTLHPPNHSNRTISHNDLLIPNFCLHGSMPKQSHLIKTHPERMECNGSAGREWVYLEGAGGELDADGGLGLEAELVAGEPGEDVGLADAGVADEHDLEEVVVLVVHPVRHRRPTTARRPPPPRILQDSRRPTRSTR